MSTFSLIKNNKIFFNIWLAQLISNFGDSFYDVAIVLYVMSITNNSAFLAGGVAISSFIGRFVGSYIASKFVDKIHTRKIMLLSDSTRAILLIIMLYCMSHFKMSVVFFYFLGFTLSALGYAFIPARNKSISEIVYVDELLHANQADSFSSSIVQILSWALGGVVYSIFGVYITLFIDLLSFIFSFYLVFISKWKSLLYEGEDKFDKINEIYSNFEIKELKKNRIIKDLFILESSYLFLAAFYWSALPLKIIPVWGSKNYGYQGAFFGVGALIMAMLIGRIKFKKIWYVYLLGLFINLTGNFIGAVAFRFYIFALGVFIAGIGDPFWAVGRKMIIQTNINVNNQGTAFAKLETICSFMLIIGWIFGGYIADKISATFVMTFVCIIQFCIVILFYFNKRLKVSLENSNLSK